MDLSQFNIEGEQDRIRSLKQQSSRLIRIRWFYIGILVFVAVAASIVAGLPTSVAKTYLLLGAGAFLLNILIYFANRLTFFGVKGTYGLMVLQLFIDLAAATYITYQQGGLDARTTGLFALPIVAAGFLSNRFFVYLVGILSGIGYIGALAAVSIEQHQPFNVETSLVPYVFYPVFYLLLAQVVVYVMRVRTSQTREQAHDAFLALLTHQLRHPSSTVAAIIDTLEHTPDISPKKYKEYVGMIKSENLNLQHLLNNLLETSSNDLNINPDEINMSELLQRVSHRVAEVHRRSGDLRLELSNTSLLAKADSQKISTALVNVINNAFEYSEEDTPVTVSARPAGEEIMITVSDNGPGISDDVKKMLFKKYSISKSGSRGGIRGLGLGLYVAKKIVQAHDGSLHLISDKSGTKVIITLKGGKNE